MTFVLETRRLGLRQLQPDDLDQMHAYLGDPKTMLYYPQPFSREFVRDGIAKNIARYEQCGYGLFGVLLKESGEFIGDCGLVWQDVDGEEELEVGYHFRRGYWGQGYATEAAKACIDFAFKHAGVDHVISLIRPENVPSRRVALRNGLRVTRTIEWKGLMHDVWSIAKAEHHQGHNGTQRSR
jgi:RimJ/RimL family protein N-acetyltransferase